MNYIRKSRVVIFILTTYIILCSPYTLFAEMKDSDWSQFRLNPQNNPVIKNDNISISDLIIKTNNEIRSTPVIINNKIFIGNHDSGEFYAYSLSNGGLIWKNKAPNWIHSEIIHVNKQLFVGYGNRFMQESGIRGTGESGLLSIDPENGNILWDFKTNGEVMPTPAFYKGTVYITTGDKYLYGINPESGEEEWSLNLGSVVSMSSPTIQDGVLYVGGTNPSVFFAVDLDKKEFLWKHSFKDIMFGLDDVPPVISENNLVYTSGIKESNRPLSVKEVFYQNGVVAAYKQFLKIFIGGLINKSPKQNYEHMLYGINANTGKVEWESLLGDGPMIPNNKSGAPVLFDDKLFVGSPITKAFYAYDSKSGELLWFFNSHVNKAPPVANKDIVYFTDTKGFVYGFNTETGDLLGKKLLGGKLAPSGPILVNDHLIVGSQDHNVYVVSTEEILSSNDTLKNPNKERGLLSYIFYIYIIPIGILFSIALVIVYLFKKIKRN